MRRKEQMPEPPFRDGVTRAPGAAVAADVRRLTSDELFADAKEVVIEHEGSLYRLRCTRKGKLILTK